MGKIVKGKVLHYCDVCGENKAKGVGASLLGPISFGYCDKCLEENAEPEVMFEYLYVFAGEVVEEVKTFKTYRGGKYLTWEEWKAEKEAA